MNTEITEHLLRADLAGTLDRVIDDLETIVVRREDGRDVALIPASELTGLIETAQLLRSPANVQRLLKALQQSQKQ